MTRSSGYHRGKRVVKTKMEDRWFAKGGQQVLMLYGGYSMFKESSLLKPRVFVVYSPAISYYLCQEISGFLILKSFRKMYYYYESVFIVKKRSRHAN